MEDSYFHGGNGKTDDVHGRQCSAAHGIDVGQRICGGHQAEGVGIIDNGSKEIDRLDQGDIIGEPVDPRVITVLYSGNEIRVMSEG